MKLFMLKFLKKYVTLITMVVLLIVFSIVSPVFLTLDNLMNIITQNAYVVVAAIGMAVCMIGGGIDLSAGYTLSIVGVVTATMLKLTGMPLPLAITAGILVGALLGFINGFTSIKLKVHSMIVTLATMAIFQGVSYTFSQSKAIFDLPEAFKFIGQGYIYNVVPFSLVIMVVCIVLGSFVLNKTYFGRYIYALGSNREAARLTGINVNVLQVIIFTVAGVFFAISGIILVSRAGSANSSLGPGTEFTCITAAVLGGVSFTGGEGKMWGLVVACFILGILSNGMQLVGMGIYPQYIAKGIILIASIAFDTYQKSNEKVKQNAPVMAN